MNITIKSTIKLEQYEVDALKKLYNEEPTNTDEGFKQWVRSNMESAAHGWLDHVMSEYGDNK